MDISADAELPKSPADDVEDPWFPKKEWESLRANGQTTLSYWEWASEEYYQARVKAQRIPSAS